MNFSTAGGTYRGPLTFPYTELRPCDVESILTEIQISRSHVKVTDILLEGRQAECTKQHQLYLIHSSANYANLIIRLLLAIFKQTCRTLITDLFKLIKFYDKFGICIVIVKNLFSCALADEFCQKL